MILTNNKKRFVHENLYMLSDNLKKKSFLQGKLFKSRVCPAYGTVVPNVHVPMQALKWSNLTLAAEVCTSGPNIYSACFAWHFGQ